MKPFKISDYAAQLRNHTDFLTELMSDDAEPTLKEDRRAKLQASAKAMYDMLGAGEVTGDTDPTLEPEEKPQKGSPTQEVAKGDRRSVRAVDSRTVGAGSPFSGVGDYTPGRASDFSIDQIFGGVESATALDHSVDSVFRRRETLGEG